VSAPTILPPAALRQELKRLRNVMSNRRAPDRARPPLSEWAADYLGVHLTCRPSPFHEWLAAELGTLHERRASRLNVLAPRGSAKSTWSTLAYTLYAAVHRLEPYILLLADSADQAGKYLAAVRAEVEGNESLRADYPSAAPGPVWTSGRAQLANGVLVEALGTGSKVRGRRHRQDRPSLIIVDDPQNLDHVVSPVERGRSWDWLMKDVVPAGSPTTNIVVLGTALHRECIVCKLQETPGWRSHVFRSVIRWPDRMQLWEEWRGLLHNHGDPDREAKARAFYEARKAQMDEGAAVLWPQREPLYALMLLEASIGPAAFASEKQNDPHAPGLSEWPASYFDNAIWFTRWPADGWAASALALDPSKGREVNKPAEGRPPDYSAWVWGGVDRNGVVWVDADLDNARDATQIVRDGLRIYRGERPRAAADAVVVEVNQFQELLGGEFLRQAKELRLGPLPLFGCNNTEAKEIRIRTAGPYLAQRQLRVRNTPGGRMLVQQLRDFPRGANDDGPDALVSLLRMLLHLILGRRDGPGQPKLLRA
jgi:predicted phage terminase large subunit-like protein